MSTDPLYSGAAPVCLHTAETVNKAFRHSISLGITDLHIRFDLPTQRGYDSDHPLWADEVGKAGIAMNSVADMRTLFMDINPGMVSVTIEAHATAFILIAFYVIHARQQNFDLKKLRGNIAADLTCITTPIDTTNTAIPANGYHHTPASGEIPIYPHIHSRRINADIREWCSNVLPQWKIGPVQLKDSPGQGIPSENEPDAALTDATATASIGDTGSGQSPLLLNHTELQAQLKRVNLLKTHRDLSKIDNVLQSLNDTAWSNDNIMPAVLEAAEHHATLGEIADTLREVYGEYRLSPEYR